MDIKFRAWDESNRVMHNNFQFIQSGKEANDWIIFTSDKQKLSDELHPFKNPYFQQQFKIMQFTGLKDQHGQEIYEGDILEHCDTRIVVNPIIPISRFYGSEQEDDWISMSNLDWEVIGNIYKNIDLL